MKEIKQILDIYSEYKKTGKKAALATVVQVEGSAYRRPGARMLILENGIWKGSISGGCLEGDALKKAKAIMNNNTPQLITYDTREKAAYDLSLGLGCHGKIDILIEPLTENNLINPLSFLCSFITRKEEAVLACMMDEEMRNKPKRLLYFKGDSLNPEWNMYRKGFENSLKNTKSFNYTFEEDTHTKKIFFEYLSPPIELHVFGAGFDVVPISEFTKVLGWKIHVYDNCFAHLAPTRIPLADSLCQVDNFCTPKEFNPGRFAAAIVMSHNFKFDVQALKFLSDKNIPYIGLMGPRKRYEKMKEEAPELSIYEEQERFFSPIGLDIGAEFPEEIALSIVSEIKSFFSDRNGEMLRKRKTPIHDTTNLISIKL